MDDQHVADDYAAALRILEDARSRLTVPTFRDVMDTYIGRHPIYAMINHGRGPESLVGHMAPAWEFRDLQGQRHALADYHGKVVVLDFWYRRCAACIIEAPHMKRVAGRYADKPVAFLGMNVDSDPKDAQFMADQQHVPYPTLVTRAFARRTGPTTQPQTRLATINRLYRVDAYPTVIVIGPDGIVRHAFVGGPTEEELAAEIDPLLPRKQR